MVTFDDVEETSLSDELDREDGSAGITGVVVEGRGWLALLFALWGLL